MASTIAVSISSPSPIHNHLKTCKTTSKGSYFLQKLRYECLRATKPYSRASLYHPNNLFSTETAHPCRNCFITHEATLLCASSSQEQIPDLQALPSSQQKKLPMRKANSFRETTITHYPNCSKNQLPIYTTVSFLKITSTHFSDSLRNHHSVLEMASFLRNSIKLHLSLVLLGVSAPFPCFATEATIPSEELSGKISLESVIIAIDDFFNRNPFFVAGVTFIWLVVIPLTEEYLKKYKFISAIDAFRKLRDNPNAQLLDIRDKRSLLYMGSPNLKIFKKRAVQVQFSEGKEEDFVEEVLKNFKDPQYTTLCILDNFDGNSMEVAELLFKNGFKETYAIRGGLRGKDGWQEIQDTLLPPAVHVFPKKEGKLSRKLEVNGGLNRQTDENGQDSSSPTVHTGGIKMVTNGQAKMSGSYPQTNPGSGRPLSPYPNNPDMKPPSSPTPSKPSS